SGVERMLVSVGGPGERGFPSRPTPFPASASSGAVACCGPNIETGKPYDLVSFATQPSVGMVRVTAAPWRLASLMKCSWPMSGLPPVTFLKYQSLAVFHASSAQLYRL